MNFIICDRVRDDADGFVLKYNRMPFIETRKRLPFATPVVKGMLNHVNQFDIAAMLLEIQSATTRPSVTVTMCCLMYTELIADEHIVHGIDTSLDPRVVSLGVEVAVASPDHDGPADGAVDGGADVDWRLVEWLLEQFHQAHALDVSEDKYR